MEITAPSDKKNFSERNPSSSPGVQGAIGEPGSFRFCSAILSSRLKIQDDCRSCSHHVCIPDRNPEEGLAVCFASLPQTSLHISSTALAAREAGNYDLLALQFARMKSDCSSGREYGPWAADQQLPPDPTDTQTGPSPSPPPAACWMLSTAPGCSGPALPAPFGPHCKACISGFKEQVVLEPTRPWWRELGFPPPLGLGRWVLPPHEARLHAGTRRAQRRGTRAGEWGEGAWPQGRSWGTRVRTARPPKPPAKGGPFPGWLQSTIRIWTPLSGRGCGQQSAHALA